MLILASTSPYRRSLLERLGLPFETMAPGVDEEAFAATGAGPRTIAESLAIAKAEAVAKGRHEAVVIGSDQVAALDGRALGKPGTEEAAVDQLMGMTGREHELITAMAVAHRGTIRLHVDVTVLTMRTLSRDEIRRYVEADRPLDCCGSYRIETRGIALFEKVDSEDFTAIVGLPLIALTTILRDLGHPLP